MTDYTGIFGGRVDYVSSDPSNPFIGQVWYNSTSATLKYQGFNAATWASGGTMPSGGTGPGSVGTQTAGLYFTLTVPGQSPGSTILARQYNGTSWSSGGSNPARIQGSAGSGTQTAALKFGGYNWAASPGESGVTINYNGTSWTSNPATLNTARLGLMGSSAGTNTAALAFGGQPPASPTQDGTQTESYNGTSWTNVNSLVYGAGVYGGGFGTQTAAIACAAGSGNPPSPSPAGSAQTQSWNGSSWTSVNSMNTGRTRAANFGIQTLGVVSCGSGPSAATEFWNGTSWSNSTNNPTARRYLAGCGTQADGLTFGGESPTTSSEELTGGGATTKTVTVS